MRQRIVIAALGVLFLVLAGGWMLFGRAPHPVQAGEPGTRASTDGGILDGMTFSGQLGPQDKSANVDDIFVFSDGTFLSTECHKICGYPARPYFIRRVGETIEFISETQCPGKDAKIVWRGTIDDGTIKGMFTWTVHRWYWTIEKDFWFEGALVESAGPLAGSQ